MLHKKQEGETETAPSSLTSNSCRISHHVQFEEVEMQFLYLQNSTLKIHKTTSYMVVAHRRGNIILFLDNPYFGDAMLSVRFIRK